MRSGVLVAIGLTLMLAGGTCVPLIDNTQRQPEEGTTLAIVLLAPDAAQTVPEGTAVTIEWTAANLTGEDAAVTLLVESRTDLSRTTLATDVPMEGTGDTQEFDWNTTGFSGAYTVIAQIAAGDQTAEDASASQVTVDAEPTFEFTAPTGDVEIDPSASPVLPVTISWIGGDNDATLRLALDPDLDHGSPDGAADDERNEITLLQEDLPTTAAADSFSWEGQDSAGAAVEPGEYFLFAVVSDGVSPDQFVDALGPGNAPLHVTVLEPPEEPNEPAALEIVEPAGNEEFLAGEDTLKIEFSVNQDSDVLIDLRIDSDDNHANGNEITILRDRLVEPNDDPNQVFEWTGGTADDPGTPVPDGIYRIIAIATPESGSQTTDESTGLVFRRAAAGQPLIGLLAPATQQTLAGGSEVAINWRDDVPLDLDVYRDAFAEGWNDNESVDATVDPNTTTPVNNGAASLAVTFDAAGAQLVLDVPDGVGPEATAFPVLRFAMHGGTAGGQDMTVTARAGGVLGTAVTLASPAAGTWKVYDVPVADFGLPTIGGLVWTSTAAGSQPVFYLDDIRLSRGPLTIFADAFASGWNANERVDTDLDPNVTTPVDAGTRALGVTFTAAGARLVLDVPDAIGPAASAYSVLRFAMHGGTEGGQEMTVTARGGGVEGTAVTLTAPVAGSWTDYDVPVADFNLPAGAKIGGLVWSSTAADEQPVFYLDTIRLQQYEQFAATVRLALDDDSTPNEAVETGAAEETFLNNRDAEADGVQDRRTHLLPGTIAPGTYYVFGYVDRDGVAPFDDVSVAGGRIVVLDPNSP